MHYPICRRHARFPVASLSIGYCQFLLDHLPFGLSKYIRFPGTKGLPGDPDPTFGISSGINEGSSSFVGIGESYGFAESVSLSPWSSLQVYR